MWSHRLAGFTLAALGLTLLALQLALLYGSTAEQALMVSAGLPTTAVMTALGTVAFAAGCLLAGAPKTTVHHVRRVATAIRRPPVR